MTILVWRLQELGCKFPGKDAYHVLVPAPGKSATAKITAEFRTPLNDIFGAHIGGEAEATEATYWSTVQHKVCGVILMQNEAETAQPGQEVAVDLQVIADASGVPAQNLRSNIPRWERGTLRVEHNQVKFMKGPGIWRIEQEFRAKYQRAALKPGAAPAALPFDGSNDIERCLNASEQPELEMMGHLGAVIHDLANLPSPHVAISVLGVMGGNVKSIVDYNLKLFGATQRLTSDAQHAETLIRQVQAAEIVHVLKLCRKVVTIEVVVLLDEITPQIKGLRRLFEGLPNGNAQSEPDETETIRFRLAVRTYGSGQTQLIRGAGVSCLDASFMKHGRLTAMRRVYVGKREPPNSGYQLHIVGQSERGGNLLLDIFPLMFSDQWGKAVVQPDLDLIADFNRSEVLKFLETFHQGS